MGMKNQENWEAYRQQMLDETSRFIEWGLAHPDEVNWIPAKPVDKGSYPSEVATWFWSTVLSESREGILARWKFLLRRPRLPL